MIERVRGRIEERGADWVVLGMGLISVRVQTTGTTIAALPEAGDVQLYTYMHMREDALILYGFQGEDERVAFERLIGVTGVGPRAAQGLLSGLSPSALGDAIEQEHVDALVRVPGIGRKTAQRIILELKGKLVPLGLPTPVAAPRDNGLLSTLVGLGYSSAEAGEALRHIPEAEGASDEERLRAAFRHLSAR